MMADFAFSSTDTKLGRFDNSFFSAVPFPGGLYFAFRSFCETLYLITARSGEPAFLDRAVTSGPHARHPTSARWNMMGAKCGSAVTQKTRLRYLLGSPILPDGLRILPFRGVGQK
jgi:hypothetical protein